MNAIKKLVELLGFLGTEKVHYTQTAEFRAKRKRQKDTAARKKAWTAELRAAQAERMRKRWAAAKSATQVAAQ